MAQNLKWILTLFEQISDMKINYHKSDLIPMNLEVDDTNSLSQIFGCKKGTLPITYLGVPLHHSKLRKEDLQPAVDKVIKRIAGWRGRLLSIGGRVTLIRACLASIPIYLLSFIKFPNWALHAINTQMAHCLWDNYEGHHKYHLANWEMMAMRKEFGGLGIPNLRDLNVTLLASWIRRYNLDTNRLWKQIVDFKYDASNPNIFACEERNGSNFWKGVLWASNAAKLGYQWIVGDGKSIRFWEDQWFGGSSLAIQFWDLYVICNEQLATIDDVWDGSEIKLSFRRSFGPRLVEQWEAISRIITSLSFSSEKDQMVWKLNQTGIYTSQTLYAIVNFRGVAAIYVPALWNITVPPRVHVFLWLLSHNKILTRDNLSKRQHLADKTCLFCTEPETVNHLFFECVVSRLMFHEVADIIQKPEITSYEQMATYWLCNERNGVVNMITTALIWTIWKFRNDLLFHHHVWMNIQVLWRKSLRLLKRWQPLCPKRDIQIWDRCLFLLEQKCVEIPRLK